MIHKLDPFPPLFFRLILAYGFFDPALRKVNNIEGIAEWFGQLGIPYPLINAYLAAGTEALAVILLPLGLFTRLISFPLMVVMCVAISVVHWKNGFAVAGGGYEIPLYYLLMLFSLFVSGGGRFSVDYMRCKDN